MSCRRSARLLAVFLLFAACGRKGPPEAPPSKIPAPIKDLTIQQRGEEILLEMTYPSVTLGGLPIESLEAIEVFQMSRILSSAATETGQEETGEETPPGLEEEVEEAEPEVEEEEEPETSLFMLPEAVSGAAGEETPESFISITGKDFASIASLAWSLSGTELDSAVYGDKVLLRIPLGDRLEGSEEEILIFAARAVTQGNRNSSFSNLVKILPRTPPPSPTNFTVEATPLGVQLDWEPGGEEIGYRVYRRKANVRDYGEPLSSPAKETLGYLDRSAEFGQRYIYTVTSVSLRNPLVESAVASEHEVDYKDRFPPAAPQDLVALAESGRVRLLWEASTSEDAAGYWIYRKDPDGEFQAVNTDLVLGSEYLDTNLVAGAVYHYYILAVDSRDNQSEPSEEIEVRVP